MYLNPSKIKSSRSISPSVTELPGRSGKYTEDLLRQEIESLKLQVAKLSVINKDYQEIVEHATEIIFKLDTHGAFYFVSAEFERMLEFTNEEMKGRHFTSILHPDDLQLCIDTFKVLEQYGRAESSIDFRVQRKSGGYKWVTCSAICRFDENGRPSHTIGMAHEITRLHDLLNELRTSREALLISEERYRSLFGALSEGAMLVSKTGEVLAINRSAEKILNLRGNTGHMLEPLITEFSCIHEDGSPFHSQTLPTFITLNSGRSLTGVIMGIQREGGSLKWISINTEPVYYSENREQPDAVVASFFDITQAKNDREELIRNQKLLAQESDRYVKATKAVAQAVVDAQEKERAEIGVELHDNVNQILSTVRLYLDLASINEKDRVDLIRRGSAGVSNAVSEIRKICHSLVPSSVKDLGLVASIDDLLQSVTSTKMLNGEFYHRGDIESISANSKLVLFRIIQEQLTNVLKHADATKLTIELVIDDSIISLTITDNGRGFDIESGKIKKGMGLYNISNRTELLNGRVNMNTAPGKGCKLNILIPI